MEDVRPTTRGNVCIVGSEFLGVTKNGGIGTAHSLLAELLASAGYAVTLLYTDVHPEIPLALGLEGTVAAWEEKGVAFHYLDPSVLTRHDAPYFAARSLSVYEWLLRQTDKFDIIHFPEWQGDGFYALCAKHQCLAFTNTILLVNTHSPRLWADEANRRLPYNPFDLELDFMERRSVELADYLVSPSVYMLRWMKDQNWTLPIRHSVIQNVIEPGIREKFVEPIPAVQPKVSEIVYFGRLETRKGLEIFCAAIERIPGEMLNALTITFLGRSVTMAKGTGISYAKKCSAKWKCREINFLEDFDRQQALAYLRQQGRIAVIPSRIENSPYTVLECAAMGIPFLATSTGGIPELVSSETAGETFFPPNAESLADSLQRAITRGVQSPRLAMPPAKTRARWLEFYGQLVDEARSSDTTPSVKQTEHPRVNVCITHFDRPALLLRALKSFQMQDYRNFDVTVVDDGSRDADTTARLKEIEKSFMANGWKLIRSKNRYLGAARNLAAKSADGKYLVFFDDDNIAKPSYLSTLVSVAEHCGADIVTCRSKYITEDVLEVSEEAILRGYVPLGAAPLVGFFRNCYGDAAALIRRESFIQLGGFTIDREAACQDWELFSKAVLSGMRLEVVAKVLYYYRVAADSMYRTLAEEPSQLLRIRPYLDQFPEALRPLALLAFGMWKKGLSATVSGDEQKEWRILHSLIKEAKELDFTSAHIYGASITGRKLSRAAKAQNFTILGFVDRDRSLIGTSINNIHVSGLTSELVSEADIFLVGSFGRGVEIAAAIAAAYGCIQQEATVIYVHGNRIITNHGGDTVCMKEID